MTDSGSWGVTPKAQRLQGAKVILREALNPCLVPSSMVHQRERQDIELEAVWEWGGIVLIFNPDEPGFTRE